MPMPEPDTTCKTMWLMLQQIYLDSTTKQKAETFTGLTLTEQRITLKNFATNQAVRSKRWAQILRDLVFIDRRDDTNTSRVS